MQLTGWLLIAAVVIAVVLFMGGSPIFVVMAACASFVVLLVMGVPVDTIASVFWNSINSFALLAMPFFILTGTLSEAAGGTSRLMTLVDDLLGHVRGGAALSVVVAAIFFGAITGSTAAAVAALSTMMIPQMTRLGYDRKYTTGLICACGTLAQMIPPSIFMILYGPLVGVSVVDLFLAGWPPGLLGAALIGIAAIIIARRKGYGGHAPVPWKQRMRSLLKALPMLGMPVIMLGGIYGGVFTPTEGAVVGCVYALIFIPIYRELTFSKFRKILLGAIGFASMAYLIVGASLVLGMVFTYLKLAVGFATLVSSLHVSSTVYLLAVSALWIILGFALDAVPMMYITVPLLWPAAAALGVDPIHFGILLVQACMIGQLTPPTATIMYVASAASGVPAMEIFRGSMPFFAMMIVTLVLLVLVPQFSTFLPALTR